MPADDSLRKDIESLKDQNKKIYQRLNSLQKSQSDLMARISSIEKGPAPAVVKEPEPEKPIGYTPVGSIILIVIGAILCISIIGAILGVPLLILGIYLITKSSKSKKAGTDDKAVVQEASKKISAQKVAAPKPAKDKASFEEDVGIKWFARIGILALVIGVGFFVKYAIDMNWINHLTRIIIGVVFGIALIIFGEVISKKEKYANWAKTLVGGGFAITYFVIYAAYYFQDYRAAIGISQMFDIILLILVVFLAILFSLKDNSQIIAAESFFLGYVTSLLSNNLELMTLIYGLLITIGLVIVVSYKKWSVIGLGGVIASYLIYFFWNVGRPVSFTYASCMLISYFVAFTAQSFFLTKKKEAFEQNIAIILLNSAMFFMLYYFQVDKYYTDYRGLFTLVFSVFYLISYFIYQRLKEDKAATANLYLAILYLTLTIPIQLNKEWITVIWALEALVLTILSLKLKINALRISSYVVGAIAAAKTIVYDTFALNKLNLADIMHSTRLISYLVTIICFFIIYRLLKNSKGLLSKNESGIPSAYSWVASGLLVFIILLELLDKHSVWISIILSVLAIAYVLISRPEQKEILYQSFAISAVLFIKVLFCDTFALNKLNLVDIIHSTRLISYLVTIVCFFIIYRLLKNSKGLLAKNESGIPLAYSWVASGLLVLILFIELIEKHSVWVSVSLSILALAYLLISKLEAKEILYQSIVISAILFVKVLFYDSWNLRGFHAADLFSSTRFFAFLVAIIVFYLISWYLESRKDKLGKSELVLTDVYSYAGTVLAFILIMIEMKEFWISVGWSILALIIIVSGFALGKKQLRLQGMIIFAITILKVFLYDTRSLETIYRTISYIVLGVILLLVSLIYTKYKEKIRGIL